MNSLYFKYLVYSLLFIILSSCNDDDCIERDMWIAPEEVLTKDFSGYDIYVYKVKVVNCNNDEDIWELFYGSIEGFEYEPGYLYLLRVRIEDNREQLEDAPSKIYYLKKILSKEKVEGFLPSK